MSLSERYTDFFRLKIVSPLYYTRGALSFPEPRSAGPGQEFLFYFSIKSGEALRIDPVSENYLGPLIAAGTAEGARITNADSAGLTLPAGDYFFTQIREKADKTDFINMAIELQKEALWERLKPGETVYFRSLWEHGTPVSQVLRPLCE
jgi:hypothetical protein